MIVTSTNAGTFIIPGSYVQEIAQQPAIAQGPDTSVLGIVGAGTSGPVGVPTPFTSRTAQATFGSATFLPGADGNNHAINDVVFNGATPDAQTFVGVRQTDGNDLAASFKLFDSTGFATGNISFSGTPATGQTVAATLTNGTTTVAGAPLTYNVLATDTPITIAAAIANLINASIATNGPLAFLKPAVASGANVQLLAASAGAPGNSITYFVTITSAGVTGIPTASVPFSGGNLPGSLGTFVGKSTGSYSNDTPGSPAGGFATLVSPSGSTSPTYRITTSHPASAEVFNAIPAYAVAGGGFNAAAFMANLALAVNSGTHSRGPSANWTYLPGASLATPLVGTFIPASGGTDGASGLTSLGLVGRPAAAGGTGMYALHGKIKAGQFVIAGLNDCTWGQTLAAFAQVEAAITAINLGPPGTPVPTAAQTAAANGLSSRFLAITLGEPYYVDINSGAPTLVNPLGAILGTIASVDPWVDPLNQPETGKNILATEWSSTQMPDQNLLQTANILYFNQINGKFVLWNDRMSDGSLISDARMLNWIAVNIEKIGWKYLGKLQSTVGLTQATPNPMLDPIRKRYANDIKSFLQPLKGVAQQPESRKINTYEVDLNANTVTSVQQGFLLGSVAVWTLTGIRYVLSLVQVGNNIQIVQ